MLCNGVTPCQVNLLDGIRLSIVQLDDIVFLVTTVFRLCRRTRIVAGRWTNFGSRSSGRTIKTSRRLSQLVKSSSEEASSRLKASPISCRNFTFLRLTTDTPGILCFMLNKESCLLISCCLRFFFPCQVVK